MSLETLKPQLTAIIEDKIATVDKRLQNICNLLTQQVWYYDWVGFYFANHATKTLHLKAYGGAPCEAKRKLLARQQRCSRSAVGLLGRTSSASVALSRFLSGRRLLGWAQSCGVLPEQRGEATRTGVVAALLHPTSD